MPVNFFIDRLKHSNFRRHEECATLLDWLDAGTNDHILDIGCGDGYYDELMHRKGAQVVGIDASEKAINRACYRYFGPGLRFVLSSAEDCDLEANAFNKAVSFCVMEHLNDDEAVMRQVHRALKSGGRFYFSADSLSNPQIRPKERERHRIRYFVNTFYSKEMVRQKLEKCGFRMVHAHYILADRLSLALVRFSWALDRLPAFLAPLKILGYLVLMGKIKMFSWFKVLKNNGHSDSSGLTLLVEAEKMGSSNQKNFERT